MKKIFCILSAILTRFICWLSYKVGCYRNITSTLNIYKDYTMERLKDEMYILIDICNSTGLDCEYLRKIVSVRLSAGIIRMLEINGSINLEITSKPQRLKELIEKSLNIEIQETEYGKYKHVVEFKNNILPSSIDCDNENRRRLELYNIVLMSIKED